MAPAHPDWSNDAFPEVFAKLAAERGLSQREIARRANVSQSHLSRLVRRADYRVHPSLTLLRRVALALGIEPEHFREYREQIVLTRVREDAIFRDDLYGRIRHSQPDRRSHDG